MSTFVDDKITQVAKRIIEDFQTTQIFFKKRDMADLLEQEFQGFIFLDKPKKIAKEIIGDLEKGPGTFLNQATLEGFLKSKYQYDEGLMEGNDNGVK